MITHSVIGQPLTHQRIIPGNTATGIQSHIYTYTEWVVAFTSGGTTEIVAGDWVVGATSAAKAQVVSITTTSGVWGSGTAAGTMRLKSYHPTWTSGEKLKVAAGTDDATMTGIPVLAQDNYLFKGKEAQAALVTVLANTVLINIDGGNPDQSSLVGIPLAAGTSIILQDETAIREFKCIDYTSGSASNINVALYF